MSQNVARTLSNSMQTRISTNKTALSQTAKKDSETLWKSRDKIAYTATERCVVLNFLPFLGPLRRNFDGNISCMRSAIDFFIQAYLCAFKA